MSESVENQTLPLANVLSQVKDSLVPNRVEADLAPVCSYKRVFWLYTVLSTFLLFNSFLLQS